MFFGTLIGLGMGINYSLHMATGIAPAKQIALTFDDGPYGTSTSQILHILEREHVPATFFLIGKNVEMHPEQVQREIQDGDTIGNHSYSHSRTLPTMSSSTLRGDISHAQQAIIHALGTSTAPSHIPHLFRPPYSSTSPAMIAEIHQEGYVMAGWNIDPVDWDNANSSTTIAMSVISHAKSDGIVILHDGHEIGTDYSRENTIEALPAIIDSLRKQGYTFVTIDKILGTQPYRK